MKILVIGASRGIGRACVQAALAAGHEVRAFSRSAGEMTPLPGLEPWPGDATKAADLAPALEGVDAVVQALGIKADLSMMWREITLFSDSTAALVPLMEAHGPDRLICVTGIGSGDSFNALSTVEKIGHSVVFSKVYGDKTRQEEIVKRSSLRWTLVRPTILTSNARSGRYKVLVDPASWRMGVISRADVADYVVRALDDVSTVHTAPVLAR
ncbi:NAD(P)-dependent oxidoreductase [Citreimonas salinaria]|uniref:Putative NADH-flavin reductase n=1 Tax=Citreimonas salinaria TaxID=321339 RepID=A0A1H3NLB3_9RHOB|nr:NAD(P)H-binding protein [Citreimonas salinaria]SDY88999.1 Putative NADH-flavin reductase [Citreimonas salinaria]